MKAGRLLTADQERWLRIRRHLSRHRHQLTVRAFADYGVPAAVGDAPLLTSPDWLPPEPVPLLDMLLDYRPAAPFAGVTGMEKAATDALPLRPDHKRYRRYSEALIDLAAAGTFHNLPTYRLLSATLLGSPRLSLSDGHYFDGLDVGEACAHEYAGNYLGEIPTKALRTAVGDPTDFTRRPANVAVSALTLRYDRSTGTATMPLHRRDATKVGHAGGLIQVLPVGVFQPSGPEPWNVKNDLSLWRLLLREYAEELLGASENYPTSEGPFDYDAWPFGVAMTDALREGRARASVLGMGVDPLTFATDLLACVVFDSDTYDDLFPGALHENAEGSILPGVGFTSEQVERYAGHEPTQAAGAALLRLAWRHRDALLAR